MNPYLPKVLENLGALVYNEIDNEGQTYFSVTSVVSLHGEHLLLKQVSLQTHVCDRPRVVPNFDEG